MALPILILAGIMSVITAPGLIAQHLEARKAKKSNGGLTEVQANG